MKTTSITINHHIDKAQERTYYELPFTVPENVCRIDIEYRYERHRETMTEQGIRRDEVNIVDLALRDAQGEYVGASGSDRNEIYVCGWSSAQGYARTETRPGEWAIIVGAYKIEDAGLDVTYTITFTHKERQLLRGDTHMHTLGSDGVMSVYDTALTAKKQGLDYIFITDHNNYAHNMSEPQIEGITVLPGTEWTNYDGHAGLLGVKRPFGSAFCVNNADEAWAKLREAKENGAFVVLNHPFCPFCGWHFGMEGECEQYYDAVEIINGGGMEAPTNRDCLAWWHEQLCKGRHLPIIAGSDFHRPGPMSMIGLPTTGLYALSRSQEDIMEAVRGGHSYISLLPGGLAVEAHAGDAILGDTAAAGAEVSITFSDLKGGDTLRLITDLGVEEVVCGERISRVSLTRTFAGAKFCRFEVTRTYLGTTQTVLISNPIYFA